MVRNLMVMLGLCLAVASSGCFFEEASPGMAMDACDNDEDAALIDDPTFDATVAQCAQDAGGSGTATATCLEDAGLTPDCASCYGDQTDCVVANCLNADDGNCADDPEGDDCAACREMNCDEAFAACRGPVDGTGGNGGTGGAAGNAGNGGAAGNGGGGGNAGG